MSKAVYSVVNQNGAKVSLPADYFMIHPGSDPLAIGLLAYRGGAVLGFVHAKSHKEALAWMVRYERVKPEDADEVALCSAEPVCNPQVVAAYRRGIPRAKAGGPRCWLTDRDFEGEEVEEEELTAPPKVNQDRFEATENLVAAMSQRIQSIESRLSEHAKLITNLADGLFALKKNHGDTCAWMKKEVDQLINRWAALRNSAKNHAEAIDQIKGRLDDLSDSVRSLDDKVGALERRHV